MYHKKENYERMEKKCLYLAIFHNQSTWLKNNKVMQLSDIQY